MYSSDSNSDYTLPNPYKQKKIEKFHNKSSQTTSKTIYSTNTREPIMELHIKGQDPYSYDFLNDPEYFYNWLKECSRLMLSIKTLINGAVKRFNSLHETNLELYDEAREDSDATESPLQETDNETSSTTTLGSLDTL